MFIILYIYIYRLLCYKHNLYIYTLFVTLLLAYIGVFA